MTGDGPARLPRLVVAAPGSGHGKTMVATGLMGALRARGLRVSPHKVGPDYIDPGYHSLAAGRVGRNLDPFLQGEDLVVPLLLHGARTPEQADVAVVEGVMGLFDGALGTGGFSSTAHVARLLQAPVVLVVDCAAAARSVGAVVLGFATFDPLVRIAGVILNNVASPRHEAEARDGLGHTGLPVLGVVPRLPDVVVPSRHLGLVPAAERAADAVAAVSALSHVIAEHVDLDALLELAQTAPALSGPPWDPAAVVGSPLLGGRRPVVAVAGGAAFTFAYAEHAELLRAAGARVVVVDPLRDHLLPDGTAGLLVGGGFPEVHVAQLAQNRVLLRDVAGFAAAGAPVVAECAGLLYLGQSLQGAELAGVLPTTAAMGPRLTLGYRRALALGDNLLCRAGERVSGHEFHRTTVRPATGAPGAAGFHPAWGWRAADGQRVTDGLASANVHASYLHVHWAAHPHLATRFVAAAAAWAETAADSPDALTSAGRRR